MLSDAMQDALSHREPEAGLEVVGFQDGYGQATDRIGERYAV
jgi:hypothetical protein